MISGAENGTSQILERKENPLIYRKTVDLRAMEMQN